MAQASRQEIDELRTAVLHFLQMAACFEVRGDRDGDEDARRTLDKVVALLLAHRQRLVKRQRASLYANLVDEVADLYRAVREKRLSGGELRDT